MGTIQSSVGLISGINSADIIDQLLSIESRPRALAQRRLVQIQGQQAAILDLNTTVLRLATAARSFNADRLFRGATATSTNDATLTASAGAGAAIGSYDFVVDRLVSTDSSISRGFADRNTTGLGLDQLAFEIGGGRLDSDTLLENLNGGEGIRRGKFTITDSAGNDATIDLSRAVTVGDVLDAVNGSSGVDVIARVDGYGITIEDDAGGAGALVIADLFGTTTAADLGIVGTSAGGVLGGTQILSLGNNTALSTLNDGNGVSFGSGGPAAPADFVIDVDGTSYNIILGEIGSNQPDPEDPGETIYVVDSPAVTTIGQLIERIESQTAGKIGVEINADGNGLELNAAGGSTITVSRGPSGGSTAIDLGFVDRGSTTNSDTDTLSSRTLLAGINSRLASSLNGGQGISGGSVAFSTANATNFIVNFDSDRSISELIDEINGASGGAVTASLNGSGNGLLITDNTTGGGSLVIADLSGSAADELGIATSGAAGSVDSGNLQTRYVSEATRVADLRGGEGIGTGTIRLTDSSGATTTLSIGDSVRSVAELLTRLNGAAGVDITARINDNGDGIVIIDDAGGAAALTIEDVSGSVAKNLNLNGSAELGGGTNQIDGSYEITVDLDPGDTLQEVVTAINDAGANVSASIVSSGSGPAPNRLVITSRFTGAAGRVVIDTFGEELGFNTLTRGNDAVVFFGSENPANGFLITSRTNQLNDVIEGVSVNLVSASDDPVEVNVSRDIEGIEEGINEFVEAFNSVLTRIDFHTRFVEDTGERGTLLGDATALSVRSTLTRMVLSPAPGVTGQFRNLTQIGVTIGEGGKLEFDADKFRTAYDTDPQGVQDLVSALDAEERESDVPILDANGNVIAGATAQNDAETTFSRLGVYENIAQYVDSLTDFVDGRFTRRRTTFDSQISLQNDRIANLTGQLDNKRLILERQFLAMEQAIASLQSQQTSFSQIQPIR